MTHNNTGFSTGRDIEAYFDALGEGPVRLALESRMRFPMPFGEYHAAMWLARRGCERRARERARREQAKAAATVALERGSQFASGAALVALLALAFGGLKR